MGIRAVGVIKLIIVGVAALGGALFFNTPAVFATGEVLVTGTVTDSLGKQARGVLVTAYSSVTHAPVASARTSVYATAQYTMNLPEGQYDFTFNACEPISNCIPYYPQISHLDGVDVSVSNSVVDYVITANTHTFSGTLRDNDGNPIPATEITLSKRNIPFTATTTSDGLFSITAYAEDEYYLAVQTSNSSISGMTWFRLGSEAGSSVDLTSDVSVDMIIPIVTLTVDVRQSDGSPAIGYVPINAYASTQWEGSLAPSIGPMMLTAGYWNGYTTINSGTVKVVDGAHFPSYADPSVPQLCARQHRTENEANTLQTYILGCHDGITMNGDTVATITLPYVEPMLPAVMTTSTGARISWHSTYTMTSYDIYRDGVVIGTTTDAVYNDTAAAEGSHTYMVLGRRGDGREVARSQWISAQVDKTAPTIVGSLTTQPNQFGWFNTDVTATFNCYDTLSGIASCSSETAITKEGAGSFVVGTAFDNAGNSATNTVTANIDKTAPIIAANLNAPANQNGWHNSPVVVSFDCSDALSGVDACSSPVTISSDILDRMVTGSVTDRAGNASQVSVNIKYDSTVPTISNLSVTPTHFSASPGPKIVTMTANASDALSGVAGGICKLVNSTTGVAAIDNIRMTNNNGTLSAQYDIQGLPKGDYRVSCQSVDSADNMSSLSVFGTPVTLVK